MNLEHLAAATSLARRVPHAHQARRRRCGLRREPAVDDEFYAGARLRFTAPSREVRIEESGQMKWMTGRGYEGEWTVGWALR